MTLPAKTPREIAEELKSWALAAGFDRAGVARLEPQPQGAAFRRWLTRGDQAGMSYLERRLPVRLDPRLVFPGARSALCVALSYHPLEASEAAARPTGDLWPRVARYARGRDYHDTMGERLAALAGRIAAAFPGVGSRPYVDTGPVLERELAVQAGLGAVGKNTNLLTREGSWFLLGELLLSLDLDPDRPLTDLCGSCTRCLTACPTGALAEPYRLDSRRCISYWTIEHRGTLPEAARTMVGDWVFGCDVCQEVCPWNSKAPARAQDEFALPGARAELDLVGLLLLSREDYVERFRGSAMKRAKLEGLQRNAAVAMGNRGDRRYVGPLTESLATGAALVRSHAAWALGQLGGEDSAAALVNALDREPEPEVRSEIEQALARARGAGSSPRPERATS